jgi:glycosyltransferase involved in cell wall biosynthesis
MTVIVSNGFNKFPLAAAAAGLAKQGALAQLVTGAYPKSCGTIPFVTAPGVLMRRLAARREDMPDKLVSGLWWPEIPHFLGQNLARVAGDGELAERLMVAGMQAYGDACSKIVRKAAVDGARVYHYRAGFGQRSVAEARKWGLATVCDYSIVHPSLSEYLCSNGGLFPPGPLPDPVSAFWRSILTDMRQAGLVLVNSDFVRQTLAFQGWDVERVRVIYMGIDDQFLGFVGRRSEVMSPSTPIRLLFAGNFNRRKGAAQLIQALTVLKEARWELAIAGSIDRQVRKENPAFFADPRVAVLGWLPRRELASQYARAEVLVFPSLAEGSARVIFEALACGVYVITTPNAGSVVQDGIHGRLVQPGNVEELSQAIAVAAAQRPMLRAIGEANIRVIRERFTQNHYVTELLELYGTLADHSV